MPLFFRGFNLYKQVSLNSSLVTEFTKISIEETVEKAWFNHCLAVFQIKDRISFHGSATFDLNIKELNIVDVALNNVRIVILNEAGGLFKIDFDSFPSVKEIPNLPLEDEEKIIRIQSSSKLFVAYSTSGHVYNVSNKLDFKNCGIIDIKCGSEHCLLLDNKGNVFSFGRGSRGQLGHGSLDDEPNPKQIDQIAGIKIKAISTGYWHSCALSDDGVIYVWGWNGNGQLGLNEPVSVMGVPRFVVFPDDAEVISMGCGNRHTVVLLDNKKLYGCGWNKYKQLTNDDVEDYQNFNYLHDFSSEQPSQLACGPWNTSVMCNRS